MFFVLSKGQKSIDRLSIGFYHLINGGAREDRTPDLLRARQALSQLSYGPQTNIGGPEKI